MYSMINIDSSGEVELNNVDFNFIIPFAKIFVPGDTYVDNHPGSPALIRLPACENNCAIYGYYGSLTYTGGTISNFNDGYVYTDSELVHNTVLAHAGLIFGNEFTLVRLENVIVQNSFVYAGSLESINLI